MDTIFLHEPPYAFSFLNTSEGPPAISLAFPMWIWFLFTMWSVPFSHQHCSSLHALIILSTVAFWLLKYFAFLFAFSVEHLTPLSKVHLNSRSPLCTVSFSFPSPPSFMFVFHSEISHFLLLLHIPHFSL